MSADRVISFKKRSREIKERQCEHLTIIIDEALWHITCEDCGAILDPISYLSHLANTEAGVEYRLNRMYELLHELENRRRYTCKHCKKINVLP